MTERCVLVAELLYNVRMMEKEIFVLKSDGTRQPFEESKLQNSLMKSGASGEVREKIVRHIAGEIKDGMSTNDIYRHAFELLHKFEQPVANRYSLKRAVAKLGPTGFPFEHFISDIFQKKGFETMTDQIVKGHCTSHEMDVVAWNEHKLIMAEAKFHHEFGMKSDVKVALYIKARFDDLRGQKFSYGGRERELTEGLLITNTNFTEKAIEYSQCAGVRLIGWNYPEKGNLHDMITESGVFPHPHNV